MYSRRPSSLSGALACALLLPATLLILSRPASAQEAAEKQGKGSKGKPPASELPASLRAVDAVALARQLVEYAERSESPEALLLAADILSKTPSAEPLAPKKQQKLAAEKLPKAPQAMVRGEKSLQEVDVQALLSRTKQLAAADPSVEARIESLMKEGARAKEARAKEAPATRVYTSCVQAGTKDIWSIVYPGLQWAGVRLIGDGDTDLDLYVFDVTGLVDSDIGPTDDAAVVWYVQVGGEFRIEVENLGFVYNCYMLVSS